MDEFAAPIVASGSGRGLDASGSGRGLVASGSGRGPEDELALLDYRRQVADLYAGVRARGPSHETWRWWRDRRDELFAEHPASPLTDAARRTFDGLPYAPYDPALHLGELEVAPAPTEVFEIGHSSGGSTPARRFGTVTIELAGATSELSVFWIDVYGGGVFVPLRDASNGATTYGGGRYLLDTVKSADLGGSNGRLLLDLNFAYHPSCAHEPRWSCPLAPIDDRLPVPVDAGEQLRASA